jgi:predicted nucleic acid-binding protein
VAWVVDTSVLIDVLIDDRQFADASIVALEYREEEGLLICPVTYAELGPAFQGSRSLQEEFLSGAGVAFEEAWHHQDTLTAFHAWHEHTRRRRSGEGPKRPIADILIGAFATRFDGLITRNTDDFRTAFPDLEILDPTAT